MNAGSAEPAMTAVKGAVAYGVAGGAGAGKGSDGVARAGIGDETAQKEALLAAEVQEFVRREWALFEDEAAIRIQLVRAASSVLTGSENKVPEGGLDALSSRIQAHHECWQRIHASGDALCEARLKREEALKEELSAREAEVVRLQQELSVAESLREGVKAEADTLRQIRNSREQAEQTLAPLRESLQEAEASLESFASQAEQALHQHKVVAEARRQAAIAAADAQSLREQAALLLHYGQHKKADATLAKLPTSLSSADCNASTSYEEKAVSLMSQAQLASWSDMAFPAIAIKVQLIQSQAQLLWGLGSEAFEEHLPHNPKKLHVLDPTPTTKINCSPRRRSCDLQTIEVPSSREPLQATICNVRPTTPSPQGKSAQKYTALPNTVTIEHGAAQNTPEQPIKSQSEQFGATSESIVPNGTPSKRLGRYSAEEDLAMLQYVAENGATGATGETYWQKALSHGLMTTGPASNNNSRSAASLRERWRKVLKDRFEKAAGDPVAAVAAQHAHDVRTPTQQRTGRRASLDGSNRPCTSSRRQQVPKAVCNALWRRDCGEEYKGRCAACNGEITVHTFEAGHVVSDKHGGATDLSNLRVICGPCNKSCGARNLFDFKAEFFPNESVQRGGTQVELTEAMKAMSVASAEHFDSGVTMHTPQTIDLSQLTSSSSSCSDDSIVPAS